MSCRACSTCKRWTPDAMLNEPPSFGECELPGDFEDCRGGDVVLLRVSDSDMNVSATLHTRCDFSCIGYEAKQ
jgi:hypothetical protein